MAQTHDDITIKQQKSLLRKEMILKRDELSKEVREKASEALLYFFKRSDILDSKDSFLLFASYGSEIGTDPLIGFLLEFGKKVFLPRIETEPDKDKSKYMEFYEISSLNDLDFGFKGIREPADHCKPFIYDEKDAEKTVMIMPGVAFDKDGHRLGYGGGFYDRFLAKHKGLHKNTVAIGYKMQEIVHIPSDCFDIKPTRILLL